MPRQRPRWSVSHRDVSLLVPSQSYRGLCYTLAPTGLN